jgi:hypothetical protein
MDQLPDREKVVVSLYYFEGLTLADISRILGVTESRIAQLHTRALLHLEVKLGSSVGYDSKESTRQRIVAGDALGAKERSTHLIDSLVDMLGMRLVAYLAGVSKTSEIPRSATLLSPADAHRMLIAQRVSEQLLQRNDSVYIQSWFQGKNPYLGDRSPARILRESDPRLVEDSLIRAARYATQYA